MAKVLLVEDDFSLRDIYSARFAAEGYTVVTASDGEEALAVAVRERPDLIVLDVMMPKISGFDVLDILRTTPETKNTKVIMMTALSQEADRQRGEALGVNKYLIKSQVTLEDVVTAVKQTLAGTSSTAETPIAATPTATPPAEQVTSNNPLSTTTTTTTTTPDPNQNPTTSTPPGTTPTDPNNNV